VLSVIAYSVLAIVASGVIFFTTSTSADVALTVVVALS
jgi:hypothetical protein